MKNLGQGLARIHSRAEALFSYASSFDKMIRHEDEYQHHPHLHQQQPVSWNFCPVSYPSPLKQVGKWLHVHLSQKLSKLSLSFKEWKSWSPCYPLVGLLLLLLAGHDPHSLSDWSPSCHFRSPHSPLQATQRTRPGKSFWKTATLEQFDLIVDEVVVLNPPDVQRLDSGPEELFLQEEDMVDFWVRKCNNLDVSRSWGKMSRMLGAAWASRS